MEASNYSLSLSTVSHVVAGIECFCCHHSWLLATCVVVEIVCGCWHRAGITRGGWHSVWLLRSRVIADIVHGRWCCVFLIVQRIICWQWASPVVAGVAHYR